MNKKIHSLLLVMILVFSVIQLFPISGVGAEPNYTIVGDLIYIDDSKVTIEVWPHTSYGGWVNVNFTSKVYTGPIDFMFGFNGQQATPTKAILYQPHQKSIEKNYTIANADTFNYTLNPNRIWVWRQDNATTPSQLVFERDFETWSIPLKTVYWTEYYDVEWRNIAGKFDYINRNFQGFSDWYYATDLNIVKDKEYHLRIWVEVPPSLNGGEIKYYFGFKPSGETFSQAITNNHFYYMDPWFNNAWGFRKQHNITGTTPGALTNYQIFLNVHFGAGADSGDDVYLNSNSQTDFDDIRFTDSTGAALIDHWIETVYHSDNATVWVEVPTIPALGGNATIYIYYGNVGAADASDGEETFPLFDDFPGAALNATKWTITTDAGGSQTVANSILTQTSGVTSLRRTGIHSIASFNNNFTYRSNTTFPTSLVRHSYGQGFIDNGGWPDGTGMSNTVLLDDRNGAPIVFRTEKAGAATDIAANWMRQTYDIIEVQWNTTASFLFQNTTQLATTGATIPIVAIRGFSGFRTSGGNPAATRTMTVDFILVRQWVNPEPVNGDWGAEEMQVATITISFYAQDGTTTADSLTPVCITYTNTTATFESCLAGLTLVIPGQTGSINFTAQAYNTSNTNSFVKINSTNSQEWTAAGSISIRYWLSIYQGVTLSYQRNNGTAFVPASMGVMFGNNGTVANVVSNTIFVNGSNTIINIVWHGDNVKNATTTFNVTSDADSLVFEGRIYTLRLTAKDIIDATITTGIHYNLTLANATTVGKLDTSVGIVGIYLQNDTSAVTVTAWWHGILVNVTTTYIISGDNTSNINVQVASDGSSKTRFASGSDQNDIHGMMIEGLGPSYQVEPTTIILNGTTYTSGTWIGTSWNYTVGLNLLNATYQFLNHTTVIHDVGINIITRQVNFNATGSETSWVVAYLGVACSGTLRTINVVNEIDADVFDAGGFYELNVTAFYDTFLVSVGQNQTSFTVCDEPLLIAAVAYVDSGGTRQTYFRTLIPSAVVQNMYIPDIRENDIALYTLSFIDLTDSFAGSTIRVTISGIEVASGFVDSGFRFEVYLIDGHFFDVTLTATTGSFTAGGLNANPASTVITITIGAIDMDAGRNPQTDVVIWITRWVGANIQIQYDDLDNATTALTISIYEQNPEGRNYTRIFNQAYGVNSSVTVTFAGNVSRGYYVKLDATQPSFGSISETRPVTRASFGFPMPNLPASVLGLDVIFPNVTNAWVYLISLMIIISTAFVFGALFSAKGAIIVGVIGVFLSGAGWLPGTFAYAIAALAIAVLANFARERKD